MIIIDAVEAVEAVGADIVLNHMSVMYYYLPNGTILNNNPVKEVAIIGHNPDGANNAFHANFGVNPYQIIDDIWYFNYKGFFDEQFTEEDFEAQDGAVIIRM